MTWKVTLWIALASCFMLPATHGAPTATAEAWAWCLDKLNDEDWAATSGYEADAGYSPIDINAFAQVSGAGTEAEADAQYSLWWQHMVSGDQIGVENSGTQDRPMGSYVEAHSKADVSGSPFTAHDAVSDRTFCIPQAGTDTTTGLLSWYDGTACGPSSAAAPAGGIGTVFYSEDGDSAGNHIIYRGTGVDGSSFAYEWQDVLRFECDGAAWDDDSDANLPSDAIPIWTVQFLTLSPSELSQHISVVRAAVSLPDA